MANRRICSVKNCSNPIHSRGWCRLHYYRWHRNGEMTPRYANDGTPHRFIHETALPFRSNDCLIWPFSRNARGYAEASKLHGTKLVHRAICIVVHGDPPTKRHHAAHSCGNGRSGCVNPLHITWKTPKQNEADKVRHGTSNRGERQGRAKLTEKQVREIRIRSESERPCDLGRRFNVSEATIRDIRDRKNWNW